MKKITIGIVAHVDGGKTTLSEALLYTTGKIRKLGRVDHKDAYLDTFQMERDRGITIFSKQAVMEYNDMRLILLDTPGHVDFSAEMERTLSVLDYAVLVVSGSEGVQGHTETLWKLLETYHVPTFLFVNKMDMPNVSGDFLLHEIKEKLSDSVVRFPAGVGTMEDIAMCDEDLFETYMEGGEISDTTISELIYNRNLFPCYFGSALQLDGVDSLLEGLYQYTYESIYSENFGAKVFKISKDHNNNRLTHLKITGGSLKVKDILSGMNGAIEWSEKVNEIRVYSGEKYDAVGEVKAGDVCAIIGLTNTYQGEGLGFETEEISPSLIPVLSYKLDVQNKVHMNQVYQQLKELEEEDPTLKITWNEEKKELTTSVMGQVQIEVLKSLIKERFDLDVEFGAGSILYKETITNTVEGVGHFEPLRHYAEVHLLLEPGMPGSGLTFESHVSENELSKNWQRLIMTHLEEKTHRGVLTGAPITDICITIVGGNAHLKHTEGGDFRQATYRAVRQGLKKAESVLLEPYYDFTLTIPTDCVGRAMTDISQMEGTMNPPETVHEKSVLTGYAPVSTMWNYINDVNEYSHGQGTLTLKFKGYAPCHNAQEVIEKAGYDSEADLRNPTGSVFCAHGAGFNVPWNEVENYMHVKTSLNLNSIDKEVEKTNSSDVIINRKTTKSVNDSYATDKELEAIFEKTFGPIKRKKYTETTVRNYQQKPKQYKGKQNNNLPECVLVDGYNIIFAWEELKDIASKNIDGARDRLLDIMSNYQGYKDNTVIVVFDAYNVNRHKETIYKHNNIYVVFTKAAETADMYIAKTTHQMASKYRVTVATSDALEQLIIMGHGALRMSAMNFKEEIDRVNKQIEESIRGDSSLENYLIKDEIN
ncbi:MAG: GTP-binding protein [Eubacterium sp.]|jgi:small GTP-binding protein|nr:GTP-binding protein [Eubacterium sp.]